MIRWELTTPGTRTPVSVTLDAEYADEAGSLSIDAPSDIRDQLIEVLSATSRQPIDEMTPRELVHAMRSPILARLAPKLVLGEEVLARRAPPRGSTDELIEDLALMLSYVLVLDLPVWQGERSERSERIFNAMAEILHVWPHVASRPIGREAAVERLAERLLAKIVSRMDFFSDRLPVKRLVRKEMGAGEARALAGVIADVLDAGGGADLEATALELRARVEALRAGGSPPRA